MRYAVARTSMSFASPGMRITKPYESESEAPSASGRTSAAIGVSFARIISSSPYHTRANVLASPDIGAAPGERACRRITVRCATHAAWTAST